MFRCNHHQQGAHYLSLLKLQLLKQLKYIGVWLMWWCDCIYYQVLAGLCLPKVRFQRVQQTYTSK